MNDPLATLDEAYARLRQAWAGADADDCAPVAGLGDRLIEVNRALGAVRRAADGLHSAVAAEIARESRPELGPEGLARKQGFRNPTTLIATTLGTTPGEAVQLVKVGEATAPRTTLTGEAAPPKHPHVATGTTSGAISTRAAGMIITMLDRAALRADRTALEDAERILVEQAENLSLDHLSKLIARAEAHLDPDGLEPRERDARGERSLRVYQRGGMIHVTGQFDAADGAIVKTAIEAVVTADFRRANAGGGAPAGEHPGSGRDEDLRSLPQRQADAMTQLARHLLGCEHNDQPIAGATVVVRMTLEDLENGTGHALIDGIDQPVSISAARRLAAGGRVIPCVFDAHGEILDWGREKRLFTKAQRLALVERDGGCAKCGAPPGLTRAHHIRWWTKHAGPTDLSNGVLLCESCHHHIHDNGWEIRIDGGTIAGTVWFIPPRHVDPGRRPRLGGRRRFDYLAA
ncbi:HNH endonuclease [Microbacterium thalassium]|uniref:5-methylcytosine-specific restriction protein A n=1 Tax=Microbacterium thalassium TaxID=362649 RepID=A0A7X0KV16_9MICO|nr:HNH endonuclease signature motif containing protein [Microbacterium thalassium]MBB6391624.1 5-methylcytosine-specific restriction protein A [Microbacterium thalassium]GLK24227.1 HNH endonuclease [Microbacterium thalassium]